jgi:hypothetical protein
MSFAQKRKWFYVRQFLFFIALIALAGCACPAPPSVINLDGTVMHLKPTSGMAAPITAMPAK